MSNFSLHHSYVIRGGGAALEKAHEVASSLLGIKSEHLQSHEDYVELSADTWTIADSRALNDLASLRSVEGRRVIVFSFTTITLEAQNALLKVLEEPSEGTYLIMLIPSYVELLETINSRAQEILHGLGIREQGTEGFDVEGFIKASPVKRLEMTETIVSEKKVSALIELIISLEKHLLEKNKSGTVQTPTLHSLLKELEQLRSHASSPQVSVKYITEHLCHAFS